MTKKKKKKEISFSISNVLQHPGSKCQGLHVASKVLPTDKDLTGTAKSCRSGSSWCL